MTLLREDEATGVIYRKWLIPSPRAALLLVHGMGAQSRRWEFLTDFFLRHDISSYAIELKGFGRTKELRGHIDSFEIYYRDIIRLRDIIEKEAPHKKIFILGESMGGLIAYLAAMTHPELFAGVICISPAFRSRLKFHFIDYLRMAFLLIADPRRQINMPFTSEMCTRDVEYRKAMDADESEHKFATPKLLFNIAAAQMRAGIAKERLKTPVLFLVAGNDRLVDPDSSVRVFNALRAGDKEIIRYPDMYHALSIELGREPVFEDILKWIEKR